MPESPGLHKIYARGGKIASLDLNEAPPLRHHPFDCPWDCLCAEVHMQRLRFHLAPIFISFLALIFNFVVSQPAEAANFTEGCTSGVGNAASLQADVATANGNNQADTINL